MDGDACAVVIKDTATGWIECCPTATKSADDARRALQDFVGHDEKVGAACSDNADEIAIAIKDLGWRHHAATPGRPQTNGRAERTVRSVLEGTRTLLEQSGLPARWWSRAARSFCTSYNATKITSNGKTPWENRFGCPCPIPLQPFGCAVSDMPATKKTQREPTSSVRRQSVES